MSDHRNWYLTPPPPLHEKFSDHQASLPRLPVPPIVPTLQRYIRAALPHLHTKAERDAMQDAAAHFEADGVPLHDSLEHYDASLSRNSSYLEEMWCKAAYLQPRDPSVINSNPAMLFAPPAWLASVPPQDAALWRTATMLAATACWAASLRDGSLPPLTGPGGIPVDMSLFPSLLGHARLPQKGGDVRRVGFEPTIRAVHANWGAACIFAAMPYN